MFPFEELEIYKKSRSFNLRIRALIKTLKLDYATENQLRRASLSVQLNLAEGNGRFSKKDVRRFYVISRSSINECVAVLDILKEEGSISLKTFKELKSEAEVLSKILFKLIKRLTD
ncbi:MAG: four helix bundle protein [Flavobacteriales bacterium]|nr:four helix bundle protein [Flavobacteriales bacterium]|tara:strand:+ start:232 stop:579 length:348 start_codon:yes stop_codon:yes gene_type:complete